MKTMFSCNLNMANCTTNSNWAYCQSGTFCCVTMVNFMHTAFFAVCIFVFAVSIIFGAIGVLISAAIIIIEIISLIIIAGKNRIFKAKELTAA